MSNNTTLEVAIGLVFIYLLYSLLATTVKEFVATLFDYRARMLERGLEQMLDGKNHSYYWWDRLWNTINPANKRKPGGKFYQKTHLFTNRISCHPLYVRAGGNSRFSKKPSYLPADVFSDILVDELKTKGKFPLLKDIADNVIKRSEDPDDPLNKDLQRILSLHIEQANGDLQRFKLIVENWYNDTMDRVSGWYKKQANYILFLIGFIMALVFNASTIEIVNLLSTNQTVREKLASNATAYMQSKQQAVSPGNSAEKIDSLLKNDSSFQQAKQSLQKIDSLYNADIKSNNSLMGLGWGDYGFTKDTIAYRGRMHTYILDSAAYKTDSAAYMATHKNAAGKPARPPYPAMPGFWSKLWFILFSTFSSLHKWLGFLITALAVSLGAPFWFDLLNKFINLRVSGTKPDDKKSTPISKTAQLNQKPDPTAKG